MPRGQACAAVQSGGFRRQKSELPFLLCCRYDSGKDFVMTIQELPETVSGCREASDAKLHESCSVQSQNS